MQYSHTHHTFLHRQHLLLLAAQQAELSAVEAAALQRLGIGDWLLTDGGLAAAAAPVLFAAGL